MSLVNFTILFRTVSKLCISEVMNSRITKNSVSLSSILYEQSGFVYYILILKLLSATCPVFKSIFSKLVFNLKIYDKCIN